MTSINSKSRLTLEKYIGCRIHDNGSEENHVKQRFDAVRREGKETRVQLRSRVWPLLSADKNNGVITIARTLVISEHTSFISSPSRLEQGMVVIVHITVSFCPLRLIVVGANELLHKVRHLDGIAGCKLMVPRVSCNIFCLYILFIWKTTRSMISPCYRSDMGAR